MFNTHYQPHYHPITKILWLCSSVYCRPPHQSRRIWLVAAATNQKGVTDRQTDRRTEPFKELLGRSYKHLENVIYKIKWNFQKDTAIAMQENAFVCKMAVILCEPQ